MSLFVSCVSHKAIPQSGYCSVTKQLFLLRCDNFMCNWSMKINGWRWTRLCTGQFMATKVNQEMRIFLITDHKTHLKKKKINTKLSVGTIGVTAFLFTSKTSNVDTECFQLLRVCSIAKPSISAIGQSAIKIAHFSSVMRIHGSMQCSFVTTPKSLCLH